MEELRGLPPKECVSLGLPYLDELAAKARKKEGRSTPPVVLVAPSWGNKGCLNICGPNFLLDLAKAGYDVILRPHPQSLKVETEMLDTIHEMLRDYPNVSFDTEMDATASMSRADVMISDKSCVRFDFAFLYEKPVIDAFLRRGVPFSYITMDVEDPALTIENDLMNSRYILSLIHI